MAGVGVALLGSLTILFVLQPWRSCDYEDTAFGCAMLPRDVDVMLAAGFGTLVCVAVLLGALTWRSTAR